MYTFLCVFLLLFSEALFSCMPSTIPELPNTFQLRVLTEPLTPFGLTLQRPETPLPGGRGALVLQQTPVPQRDKDFKASLQLQEVPRDRNGNIAKIGHFKGGMSRNKGFDINFEDVVILPSVSIQERVKQFTCLFQSVLRSAEKGSSMRVTTVLLPGKNRINDDSYSLMLHALHGIESSTKSCFSDEQKRLFEEIRTVRRLLINSRSYFDIQKYSPVEKDDVSRGDQVPYDAIFNRVIMPQIASYLQEDELFRRMNKDSLPESARLLNKLKASYVKGHLIVLEKEKIKKFGGTNFLEIPAFVRRLSLILDRINQGRCTYDRAIFFLTRLFEDYHAPYNPSEELNKGYLVKYALEEEEYRPLIYSLFNSYEEFKGFSPIFSRDENSEKIKKINWCINYNNRLREEGIQRLQDANAKLISVLPEAIALCGNSS